MAKKISLANVALLSSTKAPEQITPEMIEVTGDPNVGTVLEGATGETDQTPKQEETPAQEPVSKRMDEIVTVKLSEGMRVSGSHPSIKKSPKWMIEPKFNGRERWFDLTKVQGFNVENRTVELSRAEVQHRGMEAYII